MFYVFFLNLETRYYLLVVCYVQMIFKGLPVSSPVLIPEKWIAMYSHSRTSYSSHEKPVGLGMTLSWVRAKWFWLLNISTLGQLSRSVVRSNLHSMPSA